MDPGNYGWIDLILAALQQLCLVDFYVNFQGYKPIKTPVFQYCCFYILKHP